MQSVNVQIREETFDYGGFNYYVVVKSVEKIANSTNCTEIDQKGHMNSENVTRRLLTILRTIHHITVKSGR